MITTEGGKLFIEYLQMFRDKKMTILKKAFH